MVLKGHYMQIMIIYEKCSSVNHLYKARVEVNETVVYWGSILGIHNHTRNILDLIRNNRKISNYIMWVTWKGHEHGILLTNNEKFKDPNGRGVLTLNAGVVR